MSITLIDSLRDRLTGRQPAPRILERFAPSHTLRQRFEAAPSDARQAAVIVLLYRDRDHQWRFPLVLRPNHLKHHQGQIALPGGACEPGEAFQETALRELHEELGVAPTGVEVLGPLTPFFIPASRFVVHPWIAWTTQRPHFQSDPNEVQELVESGLRPIVELATFATEIRELAGQQVEVPYFLVGPHKVWGATCIVLGELATVCNALTSDL
jgi:8-oxo-dGTP pyrophosphatase MutT (NUDIX family)